MANLDPCVFLPVVRKPRVVLQVGKSFSVTLFRVLPVLPSSVPSLGYWERRDHRANTDPRWHDTPEAAWEAYIKYRWLQHRKFL